MPTLEALCAQVEGTLDGPADIEIQDLRPIESAGPEHIVFVIDARNLGLLGDREVGAVLCRPDDDVGDRAAIRVANPRIAAAQILAWLHPVSRPAPGVHETAVVADDVTVPDSAHLGPFVVVASGAVLGEGVVLGPHVVVGAGTRIGKDTRVEARVTFYPRVEIGERCEIQSGVVIGGPGFGVEPGPEGLVLFPQIGNVIVGNDVGIGANTTIDCATFESTRIGNGTHIDNLTQIGHNVVVHDGVIICAQVGMGGGAEVRNGAIVGPQGAVAPDSVLGERTILGARAAIASNQELEDPGKVYMGAPAMPIGHWKRYHIFKARGAWKGLKRPSR